MENNKTCHLYTYIFLLVLSFFLFSYNVNADTDITISQTDTSFYGGYNWTNDLSTIETYISNHNYSYYIITSSSTGVYERFVFLYSSIPTFTNINISNPGQVNSFSMDTAQSCILYSNSTLNCSGTTGVVYLRLWWDTSTFQTSCRTNWNNPCFLTSNFEIPWSSSTFVLNISNSVGTFSMNSDTHWLGLYDAINYTPPSNPTALIGDFYTLVIDKFSVIADFFVDNTYLFAIPLIPIFILCIYLIKRSLIK